MSEFDIELRTPPHSVESEISVLGAAMLDKNAIDTAMQYLSGESFYPDKHQEIFRAIMTLHNAGEPVDQVSVINQLKQTKKLEMAGGGYYITGIVESTPSAANVAYYAKIVKRMYDLRRLIMVSGEIQEKAYGGSADPNDILESTQSALYKIASSNTGGNFIRIGDYASEFMTIIDEIHAGKRKLGIPSGFYDYDRILGGGFQPGLHIEGARPSMGKTALEIAIASNMAESGTPVGIASLETDDFRLMSRIVARGGRVDMSKIGDKSMPRDDWRKIGEAVVKLSKIPLYIDDSEDVRISSIIGKSRMLIQKHGVKVLFIDHLQLTSGGDGDNRNQQIGSVTRQLHNMAKEFEIPIILLSQLSRSNDGKMPTLSDLRESGEIEQNADTVTFIFRPEQAGIKQVDGKSSEGLAQINVAKNRDGATGEFMLSFIKHLSTFENYTEHRPANSPPREVVMQPDNDIPF
ncbi:MAG: replicative DNA helicase [Candidatus Marinimicrobia bacterium]|jgi:replicative DNA helicase|nr:replicative DNA helicase [Candidatus Neomarinimicrobiota bacterium]